MSRKHYNWYLLKNVLEGNFNIITRWTSQGYLEFSGPHGPVVVAKDNNLRKEFVDAVLVKLGIDRRNFQSKYDAMKSQ